MNAGQYISAGGHLALIAYVMFGGLFLRPEEPHEEAVQEVALISEAEFAAMINQDTAPETFDQAPTLQAPATETAPVLEPVEDRMPESAPPEVAPAEPAEPQPDAPTELVPPVTLDPTPPSPQDAPEISLEDPGAQLPDAPDAVPTPRPVPRIADQVVNTPEPQPEISDAPVEAVSPEAETPDVVEQEQAQAAPEETTTEIVTEAEKPSGLSSSPRPRARPANLAALAEKQRDAERAAQQAAAQPEQEQDRSDAVAEAAAAAAAALAAEDADRPAAPERPTGPPLTRGEREGMRVAVSQCWNVGAMSSEAMRTTITVGVAMNEDGTPQSGSITLLGFEGGSKTAADQAFAVARRAIIRCGSRGYPLPVEKFAHWRNIEMTFDPEEMRFK